MKKIVLATLLAAASAVASAQVTISGKYSIWGDSTKTGGARTGTMVTDPTSNIAVGVKEDLGGGLSARAVVETTIGTTNTVDGTNNTQLGDRQSTVGLASRYGSIDLGRNVHSQFLAISNNDAFSTLYGSVAGDVHNLRGLRFSNGVFAATNFGPVNATYDRSNNSAGVEDVTSASLGAKLGPVDAVVANYTNASGTEKSTVVGANAKLGSMGVFYSHSDNHSQTVGETKKGDLVGVSQGFGAFTAKASYGRTNTEVKAYNLGVDYALSKRTQVGVAYRSVDVAGTAQDIKQLGVGLTHRF
jgi:predicted porin